MNAKRFLLNTVTVAMLGLTLTACGGGGGDSSPSTTPTTPTTPPTTNTAPTISLDSASITIEENESHIVNFTTSDAQNDNVTVSVTGGASHLSTTMSASSFTINAGEVNADTTTTFTVKASDGKLVTAQTFSITVLDVEKVIDTTAINLTQSNVELAFQKETFVQFSLVNNGNIDASTFAASFDDTVLSSVTYVEGKGVRIVSRNKVGSTNISFSVSDTNGVKASEATINVSVIEEEGNVVAPTLTFPNQDNNRLLLEVEAGVETTFPFSIVDPDSNSFTCILGAIENNNVGFSSKFDCNSRVLSITTDNVDAERYLSFELQVSDGELKSNTVYVTLIVKAPTNESAKISFDYEKPFLKVTQKSSAILSYSIIDDGVTEVVFNEIQHWYGDLSDYTITHNANNKTFTVTPNENLQAADSFGVVLSFKDGNQFITHNLEVKVVAPIGEVETLALQLMDRYENAMKASREYNDLGVAFTDYLFSVGKITYTEKEEFEVIFSADSRGMLSGFGQYRADIQARIEDGEFTKQPAYLNHFIDYFEENLEFLLEAGEAIQTDLNLLASKDSVLPSVSFSNSIYELDTQHFSRFIGNGSYGEFVDDKWVYDEEYAFLNVISEKSNNVFFVKN